MELVRVTFECEECGCTVLTVEDNPTNESWVTCKDCGWIYGRFKNLKADMAQDAVARILVEVRDRFQKRF